jgi:pimeloyl-ACP methyl ester carboxylesterase
LLARFAPSSYRQDVNKAVWNDIQRFDLNPELPKFKFPTLVVTGRYDFNVAPSVAWGIHKAIPGSEFAVFEKSGHLPFCEESDGFVTRLDCFLAGPRAGKEGEWHLAHASAGHLPLPRGQCDAAGASSGSPSFVV